MEGPTNQEVTTAEQKFHNVMDEIKLELDEKYGVNAALTEEYQQNFNLLICQNLAKFIKENEQLKLDVENLKRQLINRS